MTMAAPDQDRPGFLAEEHDFDDMDPAPPPLAWASDPEPRDEDDDEIHEGDWVD
jgi:hypothetical protein